MTVVVYHDPIKNVIEVFEELYPEHYVEITFCADPACLKDESGEQAFGVTLFGLGHPEVLISADVPYLHCTEILAHELAHVAAGESAEHNDEWQIALNAIHAAYMQRNGFE